MARTPDTESNDEPTQPFSSPGPSYQYQRSDDDGPPTHASCDAGDGDASISANPGEQTELSEINMSYLKNIVTWRDVKDQAQRSDLINFDVYSDASTNTAFFKLYCDVRFRSSKGNQIQTIFLFIYPETIRTVTLKPDVDLLAPSLQFSLTQPPSLIVPGDRILQCRPQTKGLFGLMRSLAEVTNFSIQLNHPITTVPTPAPLERVIQLFSVSADRPLTNATYASVTSLYGGRGGEIVNVNGPVAKAREAEAEAEAAGEADLPGYSASVGGRASHKRRRKGSISSSPRSPAPHDRMLLLLESMYTSISRMESRLDSMEGRLDGMEGSFRQMGNRLDGMESRFGQLESNVLDAIQSNYSPCRFGTEERTEMLEEIHEQIEDRTLDMKIDCEEMLKDVEKDAGKAIEALQEEVKETLEQLEESVEENTERLVQKGLRTKLENASLRFDGTVFLET
ncbi:hypothetical protein J3F83DRAFT_721034 [Trichoderma novae-zelandiae]